MDFYQKYFLINLNDYSNIGIDLEINKLLFIVALAIILATLAISLIRSTMHIALGRMVRKEALSEESAMTLDELGINFFAVRAALKDDGMLRKMISRVGENEYTYEEYIEYSKKKHKKEKTDFKSAKFYIKESAMERAQSILDSNDTPILHTVLFCVLIFAVFVVLMLMMPDILGFVNKALK